MITYSIIQKSQLEGAHRIDAEYYQPEYLEVGRHLRSGVLLSDISKRITDFGAYSQMNFVEFIDEGVRFLRNQDIGEFFINDSDPVYISEDTYKKLSLKLEEFDIVTPRVGTLGNAAVIFDNNLPATANQNLAQIKPNTNKVDSVYLAIFLCSKYGRKQFERAATGNVQPWLNLIQIKNLKVFLPKSTQQENIRDLALEALKVFKTSTEFYQRAEELLLEELGLQDLQIEDDLSFVVNLSDVKSANRVDADYFQPKYEKLISRLKLKTVKRFEDFIKDYSTGFPFKSENYQEEGIPLIRINNIRKGFIDLTDTAYLSERDYGFSPKDIAMSGDIVLSMSGTIGMSAVIPSDVAKCSINQRILRFTPKSIETDFLVLVLNSIIGSYQLERIGTGGVQTNISYRDIKNILIPDLPKPIQQKISDLVKKSHEARKKSKELLEEAKRKVEEMVENKVRSANIL